MLAPLLFISSLLLPPAPQLRTPLRPTRYLRRTAGEPLQQLTMQTPTGGTPSEAVPVEIEATLVDAQDSRDGAEQAIGWRSWGKIADSARFSPTFLTSWERY